MPPLYFKSRLRTIRNAASIAGLMLATEALVADIKEEAAQGAAGGGIERPAALFHF